ncbi:hypothetical protein HAX54_049384 [Datura stramonium]|uniref:Uncharacterized protein n=1 Tax=Datura stramonium TaxID=4076 RepID=A0ABS8SUW3_DATST|nr:hypothetical protein [Datura stramonium]
MSSKFESIRLLAKTGSSSRRRDISSQGFRKEGPFKSFNCTAARKIQTIGKSKRAERKQNKEIVVTASSDDTNKQSCPCQARIHTRTNFSIGYTGIWARSALSWTQFEQQAHRLPSQKDSTFMAGFDT